MENTGDRDQSRSLSSHLPETARAPAQHRRGKWARVSPLNQRALRGTGLRWRAPRARLTRRWGGGEPRESPPPPPPSPALEPAAAPRRMPGSPEPPRPQHGRAGDRTEGEPGGSRARALGIPAPERPAGDCAPAARRASLQPSAARPDPPLRLPPPGPAACSPRVDLCSPDGRARGHTPGARPPCRVPARWPLPGPQAPRSARPRRGELTGRGRRRCWGGYPAGSASSAGGGERGGENPGARPLKCTSKFSVQSSAVHSLAGG